ncbi:rhomboid family intramembrane serine protease [Spirillospora sp. CA-253888]
MSNEPATGVPTCYRHPGQETYVRCTRCDRYICPDCMRDAAVGHQCVECVAEGNKGVRRARTVTPGRPVVTYSLIGLCLLAYAAEVVASGTVIEWLAMVGVALSGDGREAIGVAEGEWWRPVTSIFLHQPPDQGLGPVHLLFNMWALWTLGPQLEALIGRGRFLALFMLSGIGGSALLMLVDPVQPAIGASGSIFGLFGAYFVYRRRLGVPTASIVLLLVLNLIITYGGRDFISWEGHLGGLVVGGLLAAAFLYLPQRRPVWLAASAVTLVVLVGAMAVKAQELTSGLG